MLDVTVLINIGILIVMIITIIITGWVSIKSVKQNNKTQSTYILLQLLEKFREDEFRIMTKKIEEKSITRDNIVILKKYLNNLESLCYFCHENVINIAHLKAIYGAILKNVRDNKILEYEPIAKDIETNPERYKYLKIIFDKIDKIN